MTGTWRFNHQTGEMTKVSDKAHISEHKGIWPSNLGANEEVLDVAVGRRFATRAEQDDYYREKDFHLSEEKED